MIIYLILWAGITVLVLGVIAQIKEYWDAKVSQYIGQYGLHQNHLMGNHCKY